MTLLLVYFFLALGVSFMCSILESVLLSTNMSYVSILEKEKPNVGALLKHHKVNLNKSIASILILNTIANTLGAAGVGAQAAHIYGSDIVVYVSVVLTFGILFFSEIIPKTIGALYWKELSTITAYAIHVFIWITYPLIYLTLFVTDKMSKSKKNVSRMSRAELLASALLGEHEGVIDEKESDVIENVLRLDEIKVKDILTPRSVVFAVEENRSIKDIVSNDSEIFNFSRVPLYKENIDTIVGIALTKQIFEQALKDDSVSIKEISNTIFHVNENVPVSKALDLFVKKKEHMFLVVDNYDQTEGIVTLEDCIETLLGIEIVDESDDVEDMREWAKLKMKIKRKQKQKE